MWCRANYLWRQEGYATRYNVTEEDGLAAEGEDGVGSAKDPMQGLEGLDEAGPRMQ